MVMTPEEVPERTIHDLEEHYKQAAQELQVDISKRFYAAQEKCDEHVHLAEWHPVCSVCGKVEP